MNISDIESQIEYITNSQGEKIEVVIPFKLWQKLLDKVASSEGDESEPTESGLDPIDENEPKAKILAELQESIRAVKAGETYPVSQLWENWDD
jgi:hypothetical protein